MKKVIVEGNTLLLHDSIIKSVETKTPNEFKSESLNRTQINDEKTRETISRLISEKFNSLPPASWHNGCRNELIKAALNLGLLSLADELIQKT